MPPTKAEMLKRMEVDEEYFLRNVLPEHFPDELQPFHREMLSDVEAGNELCAFKCPRKHGKTTLLSLGHILYKIAFHRFRFGLMISDTEGQAVLNLENIKDVIESHERFIYFFGSLKNPNKWSETEIELLNGVKILAKGTGQRIRGLKWGPFRPDLAVVDDFESEHNTETEQLRTKVRRWIVGALLPSMADVYQVIMAGTVVHEKAFLATVDKMPSWKVRHYAIMDHNNKPIWPSKFPMAKINAIRENAKSMGELDIFYREYFNRPRNPEGVRLLEDGCAKFYDSNRVVRKWGGTFLLNDRNDPIPLAVYTGIDPALGKESSHNTGIITIGVDPDNVWYILNTVMSQIGVNATVEQVFAIQSGYRPLMFGIEDVGFQTAIMELVGERSLVKGLFPAMSPVPTRGERKASRIMSMEPRFKTGTIRFRKDHPEDLRLLHQAEAYNPEAQENDDDGLDALYIAGQVANPAVRVAFVDGIPYTESARVKSPAWYSA